MTAFFAHALTRSTTSSCYCCHSAHSPLAPARCSGQHWYHSLLQPHQKMGSFTSAVQGLQSLYTLLYTVYNAESSSVLRWQLSKQVHITECAGYGSMGFLVSKRGMQKGKVFGKKNPIHHKEVIVFCELTQQNIKIFQDMQKIN